MALDWLAGDLRAAGIDVREIDGWQTRARPGPFDPIGVLIHHTGTTNRTADAPSLQVCLTGRPDLAGPLTQLLVARSGDLWLIAGGRCNHAGEGALPPLVPLNTGNTKLIGLELENVGDGSEPFPARQVEVAQTASAVILRRLEQPATRCWGHKEYAPGRKPDPRGIDMTTFRTGVAARYANPGAADMTPAQIAAVKGIQAALNSWGVQPQLVVDGDPGPATAKALADLLTGIDARLTDLGSKVADAEARAKAAAGTGAKLDQLLADVGAALQRARL